MGRPSKQERKAILSQLAKQELDALHAAMPLEPDQLLRMLEHLDANLDGCSDTLELTIGFLDGERLDAARVVPWLESQGGYCDCEVLGALEDLAESLRPTPAMPARRKPTPAPPRLANPAGWDLTVLPSPWRTVATSGGSFLQLGKKDACRLTFVDASLPPGDRATDLYWADLWHEATGLRGGEPPTVDRDALDLPPGYWSVCVSMPSWVPVLCWAGTDDCNWYMEITTQLGRRAGDLKEVARLIREKSAAEG